MPAGKKPKDSSGMSGKCKMAKRGHPIMVVQYILKILAGIVLVCLIIPVLHAGGVGKIVRHWDFYLLGTEKSRPRALRITGLKVLPQEVGLSSEQISRYLLDEGCFDLWREMDRVRLDTDAWSELMERYSKAYNRAEEKLYQEHQAEIVSYMRYSSGLRFHPEGYNYSGTAFRIEDDTFDVDTGLIRLLGLFLACLLFALFIISVFVGKIRLPSQE